MGWSKVMDLAVVTGSYMKDNEKKNRYQNVGYILQNEEGDEMIMINRAFKPAGIPFKEGSDTIIVNQFEPRERDAAPAQQSAAKSTPAEGPRGGGGGGGRVEAQLPLDPGDVPFSSGDA